MAIIQIREVPEPVYDVIRRRARAQGKSIQAYMLDVTIRHASRPDKAEVARRLSERRIGAGVDLDAVVEGLRGDRDERAATAGGAGGASGHARAGGHARR